MTSHVPATNVMASMNVPYGTQCCQEISTVLPTEYVGHNSGDSDRDASARLDKSASVGTTGSAMKSRIGVGNSNGFSFRGVVTDIVVWKRTQIRRTLRRRRIRRDFPLEDTAAEMEA